MKKIFCLLIGCMLTFIVHAKEENQVCSTDVSEKCYNLSEIDAKIDSAKSTLEKFYVALGGKEVYDNLPVLDIGPYTGRKIIEIAGYLDFVTKDMMISPIMRGEDVLGRKFIAYTQSAELWHGDGREAGVEVMFQRSSSDKNHWVSGGHYTIPHGNNFLLDGADHNEKIKAFARFVRGLSVCDIIEKRYSSEDNAKKECEKWSKIRLATESYDLYHSIDRHKNPCEKVELGIGTKSIEEVDKDIGKADTILDKIMLALGADTLMNYEKVPSNASKGFEFFKTVTRFTYKRPSQVLEYLKASKDTGLTEEEIANLTEEEVEKMLDSIATHKTFDRLLETNANLTKEEISELTEEKRNEILNEINKMHFKELKTSDINKPIMIGFANNNDFFIIIKLKNKIKKTTDCIVFYLKNGLEKLENGESAVRNNSEDRWRRFSLKNFNNILFENKDCDSLPKEGWIKMHPNDPSPDYWNCYATEEDVKTLARVIRGLPLEIDHYEANLIEINHCRFN